MIGTLLEKLFVAVGVDLSGFGTELEKASQEVGKISRDLKREFEGVGKSWQASGQKMMKVGAVMSGAITAPLILFGKESAAAAVESREAMAQVESALKSMGPVAGYTADQLSEMAAQLQKTSTFDDDEVLKKVTANLLTFGNVQGKVFRDAQQVAVDLSARLGQDLQSSTIMLGKALNDPVKGLTALTRVGVSFSQEQTEMIKKMVAAGDTAGAQAVMLKALQEQYGGAAQAARDAAPGSDTVDAWREFQETIGELVLNVLPPLTDVLTTVLNAFNSLSPEMQTVVVAAVAIVAALGPIITVVGGLVTGFGALMPMIGAAIPIISGIAGGFAGLLAVAAPVVAVVAAIAAAGYLIYENWDKIAPVLKEFWDTISTTLGPPLKELISAITSALTELWNGPLGQGIRTAAGFLIQLQLAFAKAFGSALITVLKAAIAVLTAVFQQIGDAIRLVGALINGDWSKAWELAKTIVSRALGGIPEIVGKMVAGIRDWVVGKLGAIWDWVGKKLEWIKGRFFDLYDAVVGHSYVPDMVSRIGEEMAKLQKLMVDPADKATKNTKEAFRTLASDVSGIMDELFPDQAQIRDLNAKIATVDRALAAKQISPDVAGAARGALERQLADAQSRAAGPGSAVTDLVSRLLPNETAIKQIQADMATLDAAIAAGAGNLDEIKKARAALDVEMAKATEWPLTDELKHLTENLFPASAEINRISEDMKLLNEAFAAHQIDPAMYEQGMAALDEAMKRAEEALQRAANNQDEWGRLVNLATDFGNDLGSAVMGGLREWLTGKKSLGDALRDGLSRVLDNAISQALTNLETSIFGKGGLGGFLGNALGSLFGGARAVGGPTLPGRAYDVGMGEKFVASAHGRILSRNDAMRAMAAGMAPMGGQRQGDVHIHINGAMSDRDARRTGLQAGRAARMEMAKNARVQPA